MGPPTLTRKDAALTCATSVSMNDAIATRRVRAISAMGDGELDSQDLRGVAGMWEPGFDGIEKRDNRKVNGWING